MRPRQEAAGEVPLPFHPLADLFPLLDGEAFDELVEDVRAHGVREPIWLYQGKILDGRNRYRAAAAAGVPCPMRPYEGDDPLAFVISMNLKRRHLSASQRAMIAAKLANMRQGERTDLPSFEGRSVSQEQAARLLNVGLASVERAKVVCDRGTPEMVEAVERGEVSVSAAAARAADDERIEEPVEALPRCPCPLCAGHHADVDIDRDADTDIEEGPPVEQETASEPADSQRLLDDPEMAAQRRTLSMTYFLREARRHFETVLEDVSDPDIPGTFDHEMLTAAREAVAAGARLVEYLERHLAGSSTESITEAETEMGAVGSGGEK